MTTGIARDQLLPTSHGSNLNYRGLYLKSLVSEHTTSILQENRPLIEIFYLTTTKQSIPFSIIYFSYSELCNKVVSIFIIRMINVDHFEMNKPFMSICL